MADFPKEHKQRLGEMVRECGLSAVIRALGALCVEKSREKTPYDRGAAARYIVYSNQFNELAKGVEEDTAGTFW